MMGMGSGVLEEVFRVLGERAERLWRPVRTALFGSVILKGSILTTNDLLGAKQE
jgi:hypothetical protein